VLEPSPLKLWKNIRHERRKETDTHSCQGKGERRAGVTVVVDTSRDRLEVRGKDSCDSIGGKNTVGFLERIR
jgi:hypothetical protein